MLETPPKKHFSEFPDALTVLNQLRQDGALKKIQDEYMYWDKVKYLNHLDDKQQLWATVKLDRFLTQKKLAFGKHIFTYPATDYLERNLHAFDLNIGGTLTSNTGIAESDKRKYMISSLIEESISSSQIEGANTTRKVAKEMLQKAQKPRNKSDQMIVNNYVTMQHIVAHQQDAMTLDRLMEVHRLMTHDTLDDQADAGRFRTNDDIFVEDTIKAEKVYQPPLRVELDGLMADLIRFFNDEDDTDIFIHPIVKACIIHFMIGWIHPFVDGNGRTARALIYWYLLKKGYWLTEYLSISRIIQKSKNQYEKAYLYTEQDANDLGYFITYQVKTMVQAYDALKAYIHKKQNEVVQAAKFLKITGVNERMAQMIKLIHEDADRVLSSKEMENRFNISNFTARQDLKALSNLHFLEEIAVNKKILNYIKSAQFDELIRKVK